MALSFLPYLTLKLQHLEIIRADLHHLIAIRSRAYIHLNVDVKAATKVEISEDRKEEGKTESAARYIARR